MAPDSGGGFRYIMCHIWIYDRARYMTRPVLAGNSMTTIQVSTWIGSVLQVREENLGSTWMDGVTTNAGLLPYKPADLRDDATGLIGSSFVGP